MVFWMSVLVFLAGIMTYMFFPRNDAYVQHMYGDEAAIASFAAQHQAAKDTIYQLTTYSTAAAADQPVVLDFNNLSARLPKILRGGSSVNATHDIATNSEDETLADPGLADAGYYTSAIVCGQWTNASGDDRCSTWQTIGGTKTCTRYQKDFQFTACDGMMPAFVMTYGDMPDWWDPDTKRRWSWMRSLLRRTHGSTDCGILEAVSEDTPGLYYLNNSQKYIGYEKRGSLSVVPKVITDKLNGSAEDITGYLLCLTPQESPYDGDPIFFWDSLNNNAQHKGPGGATALKGDIEAITGGDTLTTYTLSGVIRGGTLSGTIPVSGLVTVNDGTLTVGNITLDVPKNRDIAFTYTRTPDRQTLRVSYYGSDNKWTERSDTINSAGPTLWNNTLNRTPLKTLRIYQTILSDRSIRYNTRTDRKRFGMTATTAF